VDARNGAPTDGDMAIVRARLTALFREARATIVARLWRGWTGATLVGVPASAHWMSAMDTRLFHRKSSVFTPSSNARSVAFLIILPT